MSRSWNRTEIWVGLAAVGVGTLALAILGLHAYMTTTATPLHPEPDRSPSVTRSQPSPEWSNAVERGRRIARAALQEQNLPGLSVAVGSSDDVVWAEGFGWADLDNQVPVAPETRFRIGTATIALTSAAVGLLLEQNHLRLDEPIQTYVPEFPSKPWPVTLRHLMAHVAGVRTDGGDEGPLFGERCNRPVEALRFFAERPLLFEPDTRFRHSSYGWIVVSAAIEAAADEPLFRFMRKRIFDPLHMNDTRPDDADGPVRERATPYFPRYAANPRYGLHPMRPIDLSCYSGASALLSTPSDLVRFGLAIQGGKLLQPATLARLQAPQRLKSGEETGYGLGWDVENVTLGGRQTPMVGHNGDVLGGMVASLAIFPEHGIVVAVASNISYADTSGLATSVAQAFAAGAQGRAMR